MKKYLNFPMFLTLLMLLPFVFAQEDAAEDPGVTPDSFLWGVDRALEQISLLLAANPQAKAAKGLEVAQERLLEVKAMAEAKDLPALEKAQQAHGRILLKVKENVQLVEEDDPKEQLETELELEKKLQEHQEDVEEVEAKLKIKIKIEGALSAEQQAKLDEFLASLGESAEEVEVEIKNKKAKTKIRIKEKTGQSDEEVEKEVEKLEREKGLLEEKIKVRAETFNGKSLVKVELKLDTSTTDKEALLAEIAAKFSLDADTAASLLKIEEEDEEEAEAEEQLRVKVKIEDGGSEVTVKLRFSLDSADTTEIVNAIVEKTQLTAEQVEGVWKVKEEKPEEEKEEKEIEIEVEIEDGEAEVKVETDDSETEFVLLETDREKIVQEIAARLEISVDEVLKFVTFEEEDEDDGDVGDKDDDKDEEKEEKENDKNGKKNLGGEAVKGSNSGSSENGGDDSDDDSDDSDSDGDSGGSGSGSGGSGSGSGGSGGGNGGNGGDNGGDD